MLSEGKHHNRLLFGSNSIHYEVLYQERKTLGIRVYPDCSVKVIAPLDTPLEVLEHKIRGKASWIVKKQREFLSYHPLTPPRLYVSGETHLYLGRQYRLRIESADFDAVKLIRGRLCVFKSAGNSVEKVLGDWYRYRATIYFNDILLSLFSLFKKYDINCPRLQILAMPTRWGSCTANGKIILNPELIKAPKGSIEYVIVHELCHLVHHNHTEAFYDLQERVMPEWRKWKDVLERTLV